MLEADELCERCGDFRHRRHRTTDDDVRLIEEEIAQYRAKFLVEPRPQLPPDELRERLPLMGWLIYEASWNSVLRVQAGFAAAQGEKYEESKRAYDQVIRIANATRQLIWPEYAPRALGAIRAHALAESKYDTEASYDSAYEVHAEADERLKAYRDTLGHDPAAAPLVLQLDEMLIQLALAETGTACRFPEQGIGRWDATKLGGTARDEQRWVQKMYRSLVRGVDIGLLALTTAERINKEHGLVHPRDVNEHRLAMITGFRNPGIMTARAALLMLALGPAMESMGRRAARAATWREEREDLKKTFRQAYAAIEQELTDADGNPVEMDADHLRAQHQLRLNVALLVPGFPLPNPLDDAAVEQESLWLEDEKNGGGPNNGNVMGSAIMPLFIQSVVALRSLTGDGAGYAAWRQAHPRLGRYADEDGRLALIAAAMAEAAGRDSLRIGAE
jgi:tetratricopeptide (TPR) repeat protein